MIKLKFRDKKLAKDKRANQWLKECEKVLNNELTDLLKIFAIPLGSAIDITLAKEDNGN